MSNEMCFTAAIATLSKPWLVLYYYLHLKIILWILMALIEVDLLLIDELLE